MTYSLLESVKMLDEEDAKTVKDLFLQGKKASNIAEELGCDVEEVLKTIGLEEVISDVIPQKTQSKAFEMFEEGKKPAELVKEGILTVDSAGLLYNKYIELEKMVKPDGNKNESVEKLSTQLGLLGSRLSRVELKVMNSILLPETRVCGKCGKDSSYGVGVVCSSCKEIDVIQDEKEPVDIVKGIHELIRKKD